MWRGQRRRSGLWFQHRNLLVKASRALNNLLQGSSIHQEFLDRPRFCSLDFLFLDDALSFLISKICFLGLYLSLTDFLFTFVPHHISEGSVEPLVIFVSQDVLLHDVPQSNFARLGISFKFRIFFFRRFARLILQLMKSLNQLRTYHLTPQLKGGRVAESELRLVLVQIKLRPLFQDLSCRLHLLDLFLTREIETRLGGVGDGSGRRRWAIWMIGVTHFWFD